MNEPEQGPQARRIRVPGFLLDREIGLGSAIKRVTVGVGVRPCGGCQRRAAQLDRRVILQGHRRARFADPLTGGRHHGF